MAPVRQDTTELEEGRSEDAAARIAHARAWAEREVQRSKAQVREVGARLLQSEAQRARDLEALREAEEELELLRQEHRAAHKILQAMQRTRLWRLGSGYWRMRDWLLRRS